jgi:hypothetical protein
MPVSLGLAVAMAAGVLRANAARRSSYARSAAYAATDEDRRLRLERDLAQLGRRLRKIVAAIDATRDEAFELIRSLIDRIVLMPVDGELRIHGTAKLAGILGLCEQPQNARPKLGVS